MAYPSLDARGPVHALGTLNHHQEIRTPGKTGGYAVAGPFPWIPLYPPSSFVSHRKLVLHNQVAEKTILAVPTTDSRLETRVKALVRSALDAGGTVHITIVAAQLPEKYLS